jgi:hypothetical protein
VVFYAIFCGGLLQRAGHFFVALLQPACLLVFTRVFKFLSPLSLPISPPGRVSCEVLDYGIFLMLFGLAVQNGFHLPSAMHFPQSRRPDPPWFAGAQSGCATVFTLVGSELPHTIDSSLL